MDFAPGRNCTRYLDDVTKAQSPFSGSWRRRDRQVIAVELGVADVDVVLSGEEGCRSGSRHCRKGKDCAE